MDPTEDNNNTAAGEVEMFFSASKVRWGRIGARAILLGLGFLLGSTHMNAPSAAVPGVNVVNNSTDQTQHLMGHTLLPFEASTLLILSVWTRP